MSRFGSGDGGGLLFIPYVVLIGLVLTGSVPINVSGLERIEIGLFFAPLFFICVTSESDFTPVALALIGLLHDLIKETPIGYWAVLFILFYGLCRSQRNILQNASFGSFWVTFGVLTGATFLLGYMIALLRDDMAVSGFLLLISLATCVLSFPVIFGPLYLFRDRILAGD